MSALAALYVSEIANGHIPAPESPEAKEYQKWSYNRNLVESIVRDSAIRIYGHDYYLLGSMV